MFKYLKQSFNNFTNRKGMQHLLSCLQPSFTNKYTVKPVSSSHSKLDKTKVLMEIGSLLKVESIAECSLAFCNTFDLQLNALINNQSLKPIFSLLFELLLKRGFTVFSIIHSHNYLSLGQGHRPKPVLNKTLNCDK